MSGHHFSIGPSMADINSMKLSHGKKSVHEPVAPSEPFLRAYLRGRYVWLMFGLLFTTMVGPLIGTFGILHEFYVGDLILLILFVIIANTFFRSLHTAIILGIMMFGAITFGALSRLDGMPQLVLSITGASFETCLLMYMTYLVSRGVFTSSSVDADIIFGSISIYLLLGAIFAEVYSIFLMIDPGAFNGLISMVDVDPSLGPNRSMLYYSFTTLTTLGYGDISPVAPVCRTISNLEAIVGQLYLTVLVARLVGQHIALKTLKENA